MMKNISRSCVLAVLVLLTACAVPETALKPQDFATLPGWQNDKQSEALPALAKSCAVLSKKGAYTPSKMIPMTDWRDACAALANVPMGDDAAARRYFETWFRPYAVIANGNADGLFTGYYEASLKGSLQQGGVFQTPLWQRPRDLINVDLGDFKDSLAGQKITGKVVGQKLKPYDDRTEVAEKGLAGRADVLCWTDDPVAAFFLEIQGSGRVTLPDGSVMRVGFDAQNGHEYVAVGRAMLDDGLLQKPVTMDKIRTWLKAHPDQAQSIMNRNPSVVFFRKLNGDGPIGAQGVALTAQRSLAVDPAYMPLGAPVWLDVTDGVSLQRLVVAQDTGGAIKGAVRGDMFWGYGPEAEAAAGPMQARGQYFVLLPKAATAGNGSDG